MVALLIFKYHIQIWAWNIISWISGFYLHDRGCETLWISALDKWVLNYVMFWPLGKRKQWHYYVFTLNTFSPGDIYTLYVPAFIYVWVIIFHAIWHQEAEVNPKSTSYSRTTHSLPFISLSINLRGAGRDSAGSADPRSVPLLLTAGWPSTKIAPRRGLAAPRHCGISPGICT